MRKLKKGDDILVIAGKDKGKRGKIIRLVGDDRVVVENVNLAKRHTKANPMLNRAGGIVEKEMPLHISNVALYNPATQKADRVGFKILEDGQKVRYFKSNNEVVDL
jgi:large subunit ribosomal protein L24